jgi:hypothetical protein
MCTIKILGKGNKKISFDYANQLEVKTSRKNLTDTATVKVAKKMYWKGKPLTDFVGRGDEIEIECGYLSPSQGRGADSQGLQRVFKGYLTEIENSYPLVLKCENEMWRFKKIMVPAEKFETFDLKAYIEKYGGVKVHIAEGLSFGSMDITEEMSLSQALDKIMETYPYALGYFQDGEFYGILNTESWSKAGKVTVFDPARNMVGDSLKYVLADDVRIGVKAVSILKDNSKLEAYAPSGAFEEGRIKSDWEQRQFFCPECRTQPELQAYADRMAGEFVTDSMSGSITVFGTPHVRKGDVVELRDADRRERDRKRFVADAVDYSFGTSGYRQTVTLGAGVKS